MPEVDSKSTLWKLLWDHDPNGLLVLDGKLRIILVNPALSRMLNADPAGLVGRPAADVLGSIPEFEEALTTGESSSSESAYPQFELFARKLIFPIPDERIVAGIFVDLTREWKQKQEFNRLKHEALQEVRRVVDKQMNVAQNIAGLLGETTAETKVSLLHLVEMLQREDV
jgi:PAS domain-containing protein